MTVLHDRRTAKRSTAKRSTAKRSTPAAVDLHRWPAMREPRPAPVRARIAATLLRRVARRAGIRVEQPDGSGFGPAGGPVLRVHDPRALAARLGRDGKVGFGEAYMAGDWDSDDVVAVLTQMARNVSTLVPQQLQWIRRFFDDRQPADEDNDRHGAKRNIARHYDLSNELFAAFLDESMTYSSALFAERPRPGRRAPEAGRDWSELAPAQRRKIDRLLDQARVRAGSTVLEIGTGWGELALRAAARGAQVTSVTLSHEQAALARDRVAAAGMTDAVDIHVQDYRDVTGRYDAVVSVEMIEAVGERWWPTYFRALDERLAPGGRVGLQAILMPHDRLLASRRSWTWIHKYIFPGGLIPSERAIDDVVTTRTSLRTIDRLHFGASYAETLRLWRQRFLAQWDRIAALGFDDTFRRMWTFYLAYCEAGFRAGYLDVAQLVFAREGEAGPLPLTRPGAAGSMS